MTKIEWKELSGTGGSMTGYLHDPTVELPDRRVRPSVVICPGGGYEFLSAREADPPAFVYLSKGYNVFVLNYTVRRPGEPPLGLQPLSQLSAAVMEVRRHAQEWNCAPDKIAVCGFSAGGHLAASLGTLWDSPELKAVQDTFDGLNRPDGMILCYPVITAGELAHRGSIRALAGDDQALAAFFSLENRVTEKAPPAFLWHTVTDDGVPVENTLLMTAALHRAGVPVECHLYEQGSHGLSLCTRETGRSNRRCATWMDHCIDWMNDLFGWEE